MESASSDTMPSSLSSLSTAKATATSSSTSSSSASSTIPLILRFQSHLERRKRDGTLRSLPSRQQQEGNNNNISYSSIDFASNDYLGLARCSKQWKKVESTFQTHISHNITNNNTTKNNTTNILGSTGSRLLSGDTYEYAKMEQCLANIHGRSSGLLFNSGYDANLSLLSSMPEKDDIIIVDELIHNSVLMGIRMSRAFVSSSTNGSTGTDSGTCGSCMWKFRHNDVSDLHKTLQQLFLQNQKHQNLTNRRIFIVVESVYSMDGDVAPLKEILDLAQEFGAAVIVDEAHALGVYGRTNIHDLYLQDHNHDVKIYENDDIHQRYSFSWLHSSSTTTTTTATAISKKDEEEEEEERCMIHSSGATTVTAARKGRRRESSSTLSSSSSLSSITNNNNNNESFVGGTGVLAALDLETHPALLCSVHTFGKAAGCHGALVVASSSTIIDYLINYARPFMYSTTMPPHSMICIRCAYDTMTGYDGEIRRKKVFSLVRLFRHLIFMAFLGAQSNSHSSSSSGSSSTTTERTDEDVKGVWLLSSPSPIQAIIVPGNERCIALKKELCSSLSSSSSSSVFDLYAIRSPTVPKGQERIRIILHYHNTPNQVKDLVIALIQCMKRNGLLVKQHHQQHHHQQEEEGIEKEEGNIRSQYSSSELQLPSSSSSSTTTKMMMAIQPSLHSRL